MARPLRIEYPGAVYHITSRGNARQDIFIDDGDRQGFLTILAGVVDRCNWLCHGYCLMGNHYHLLLETPEANLSLGMPGSTASLPSALTGGMIESGISSFRGTPSATDTSISLRLAVLDGRYPGAMLFVIGKNLADLMAFHRRHDIAVDEIKPLPRPASPPAPPFCWSPLPP